MLGNYIHEWSEVWHVSGKHVWISWTAAWDLKISDLDIPEHLLNSRAHKNSNGLGAGNNNIFEYVWMLVKPLDNQVKRALLQPFDCSCLFRLHFILEDGSITNGGIFEVYAQMWCLSYTSPDIHKSKCHTQIHGRLKWLLWVSKKKHTTFAEDSWSLAGISPVLWRFSPCLHRWCLRELPDLSTEPWWEKVITPLVNDLWGHL